MFRSWLVRICARRSRVTVRAWEALFATILLAFRPAAASLLGLGALSWKCASHAANQGREMAAALVFSLLSGLVMEAQQQLSSLYSCHTYTIACTIN